MDLKILSTDEYGNISYLFASDGQLVLYLQLHVLGYAILPLGCAILSCCFTLQDVDLICTDYFAVQVRQHPRVFRVLQDGVDATYTMAGMGLVVPGDQML